MKHRLKSKLKSITNYFYHNSIYHMNLKNLIETKRLSKLKINVAGY